MFPTVTIPIISLFLINKSFNYLQFGFHLVTKLSCLLSRINWEIKHVLLSYLQKHRLPSVQIWCVLWPELILKLPKLWHLLWWDGTSIFVFPVIPTEHHETPHIVIPPLLYTQQDYSGHCYSSPLQFLLGRHKSFRVLLCTRDA